MKKMGFELVNGEPCILRKGDIYILLYVDDCLIAAPTLVETETITDQLRGACDLKNIGPLSQYLGFQITRDRANKKLYLSQETFATTMLERHGYLKLNGAKTSTLLSFVQLYLAPDLEAPEAITKEYQRQLGAINWLANGTRPDISFVASKLSEANHGPSTAHLAALKHLMRYLQATSNYGLVFGAPDDSTNPSNPMDPYGASDAAFGDNSTRVSTGGYVVYVGGGPVMWKSKKQPFVALSTAEAEFINLTPAGQALLWVNKLYSLLQPSGS